MPLHLKFSNSLATLAEAFIRAGTAPADPFRPEYLVTASTGLRKWLSMQLAQERGISAHIEFPTPQTFVHLLLGDVLGKAEDTAFTKEAMTWRIYECLKAGEGIEELEVPFAYIAGKPDLAALQLAGRVADLFDQYLTYRPDWIRSWDAGACIVNAPTMARKHEIWQQHLWRQLNANLLVHRATLYADLLTRLPERPVSLLPEHLSVFGTHTLPPVFLELLKALGAQHEVTMYLSQPTPEFWGDHPLKSGMPWRFKTETCPGGGEADWGNPLIASMGGQGRDLFNVLIDAEIFTSEEDDTALFEEPGEASILGSLQRSVYRMEGAVDACRLNPETDASLRVHCCHHPLREIEVLHDTLLTCFSADPDLTPNDVIVLAPDIESYAPFIDAVFGAPENGIPEIPHSIADRSLRASSRVVESFYQILDFLQSRFTAPALHALLQTPAFRSRFGWDDEDLVLLRKWMSETGVAWGQDATHRASFNLPAYNEYSFAEMFENVFMGYAMGKDSGQDGIYHSVEGQDSLLLGKFAEAYERLRQAARELNRSLPVSEWAEKLESCVVAPFLDDFRKGGTELRQIRNGLEKLASASEGIATPVDLKAVSVFLESLIEDGIPARGFMSRGVTFGRLTPMRAIPHKVVCLLGMQEGAFPRDSRSQGFDLLKAKGLVRTGDRAASQSDRYLFLETLLSAQKRLHISYCGFSPRDDSVSPPATPVGELLDFLHQTWPRTDDPSSKLKSPFITEHRLHGHHPDYFRGESKSGMLSYSRARFAAARATRLAKEPMSVDPIGERDIPDGDSLEIEELIRFFIDPAKDFCQNQLKLSIPFDEQVLSEDEPLEFSKLDEYQIFESLINREIFSGEDVPDLKLPPGEYGRWLKESVEREALDKAAQLRESFGDTLAVGATDVRIRLPLEAGSVKGTLVGKVGGVYGNRLIRFRATSSLHARDRLRGWILHLALNAGWEETQTVLIDKKLGKLTYCPLGKEAAHAHLLTLFRFYLESRLQPLPFEVASSEAYARGEGEAASMSAAHEAWSPYNGYNPPSANPWILLCWRSQVPFEAPWTEAFAACAKAVFGPLMEHTG